MRSAFDFSPFRRSTVGFDRLFDMLENSSLGQATADSFEAALSAFEKRTYEVVEHCDRVGRIDLAGLIADYKEVLLATHDQLRLAGRD